MFRAWQVAASCRARLPFDEVQDSAQFGTAHPMHFSRAGQMVDADSRVDFEVGRSTDMAGDCPDVANDRVFLLLRARSQCSLTSID
jgi:hypothetical protein